MTEKMLRIGFVLPPDAKNFEPFRNQPLTALYLLTILEEKFGDRLDLSLIDLRGIREATVKYYLPEKDVYFYTAMSPEYNSICKVKDLLRSLYPKALHIAGGTHMNLLQGKNSKEFSSISLGEGEENIIQIVKDIFNRDLKPIYKNAQVINLNKYTYPSRKYLPFPAVVNTGLLTGENIRLPATSVLFSRGCPFRCAFCANENYGPVRFRAPELMEEEIEYLKKEYGIKALVLRDDNAIPINKRSARPFLKALRRTGLKWRGQSRANGISEDLVELAAEAGCTDIGIGVESVSPETLKIINKRIDLEETKEYAKILKKHGIAVRIHLIFGLPGEPDDIVSRTLDFIEEIGPTSVLLCLLCPMPGSKIGDNPEEFGIKITNHNLDDLRSIFGRFDETENPQMIYEYMDVTPWGNGMSTKKIIDNYNKVQTILRKRKLNF